MSARSKHTLGPKGGLRAGERALRGWNWTGSGRLLSKPVRCKREEWYLARVQAAAGADLTGATLLVVFLKDDAVITQRCLRTHLPEGPAARDELLGWIQTPEEATHLRLCVPDVALAGQLGEIVLHNISERDPKCHPLASIPRWNTYRPPWSIRRIILPGNLEGLADHLADVEIETLKTPRSMARLTRAARGSACVLDPTWATKLGLKLGDLERLASNCWLIVDLDTLARLVTDSGDADTELVTHVSQHGIMSARVDYADVHTRGLALQDIVPYTTLDDRGRFRMQALKTTASWRRFADQTGFASLLSGETPWERKHGDVLSAARPTNSGELIATDLPWLVAGLHGPLLAPRIATHLLRMHLGQPIPDNVQYWNRWDDGNVIVRDIGDLTRRCPPLRTLRWASTTPGLAHLGIRLDASTGTARRHLVIRTGRMDGLDVHDGLPPEPMVIFLKTLVREQRDQTPWAARHLANQTVTWQFDTADGLKYAANFDAADELDANQLEISEAVVRLRMATNESPAAGAQSSVITLPTDEGLHGDRSLQLQNLLTRRLRKLIEE